MAKQPREAEREVDAKGPSMSRSQAQIATSYAPGQHFTFEGAAGACQATPSPNATPARLHPTTKGQIEMRIDEAARAWVEKAIGCRQNDPNAPRPFPEFFLHVSILESAKNPYAFRPPAFPSL